MRRFVIMVSVLAVAFFLVSSPASAQKVSKKDWVGQMPGLLPPALCKPEQYFMQNYNITKGECMRVMSIFTRGCLEFFDPSFPKVFNQPKDGTKWGEQVGACVGKTFAPLMVDKKK